MASPAMDQKRMRHTCSQQAFKIPCYALLQMLHIPCCMEVMQVRRTMT